MDPTTLQKLVEVAKRELREDESTREQAIQQFRDWIEKNPNIRDCRTDDSFILRFLRKGKFSAPNAQQTLLKLFTFLQKDPHLTRGMDILDPKVNQFATNGYICVSPFRDDNGYQVVFMQAGKPDPYKCHYTDYIRTQEVTTITLQEYDTTQLLGVLYVIDLAGITVAHVTHAPVKELLSFLNAVQHLVPLRFKGFHFINMPLSIFKWMFDLIVSTSSSEKMRKRFFVHDKIEDLHKHINPKVLPKEYGGTMPRKEMVDYWLNEMLSKRDLVLKMDDIRVITPEHSDQKTNMDELPGSFRKLNVD